jgi:hypothetical protein
LQIYRAHQPPPLPPTPAASLPSLLSIYNFALTKIPGFYLQLLFEILTSGQSLQTPTILSAFCPRCQQLYALKALVQRRHAAVAMTSHPAAIAAAADGQRWYWQRVEFYFRVLLVTGSGDTLYWLDSIAPRVVFLQVAVAAADFCHIPNGFFVHHVDLAGSHPLVAEVYGSCRKSSPATDRGS